MMRRMLPPEIITPIRLIAFRYKPPRRGASSSTMTVPRWDKGLFGRDYRDAGGFGRKTFNKYSQGGYGTTPAARRTLRIDFQREGGYYISPGNAPKWWNWQTRHLEGVVGKPVRVQIPPSAPSQYLKGIWPSARFPFFMQTGRVADSWR